MTGRPRAWRVPSSFASHIRSALHLYVHCSTSVGYLADLNATVPGIEHYAERALLLAEQLYQEAGAAAQTA